MIITERVKEILSHPDDGALTFVTRGEDGPHLAATWNSYITLQGDEMLLPVGGMKKTESNLAQDNRISLIVASRQVPGLHGNGAGFYIEGTALFLGSGPDTAAIQTRFPWARGAIRITPLSLRQIN